MERLKREIAARREGAKRGLTADRDAQPG